MVKQSLDFCETLSPCSWISV